MPILQAVDARGRPVNVQVNDAGELKTAAAAQADQGALWRAILLEVRALRRDLCAASGQPFLEADNDYLKG